MSATTILLYAPPGGDGAATGYEGKFLQLRLHGHEYLVFAPRARHRYHNQVLAHFLEDHGLLHRWITPTQLAFDAPALHIVGGGRFRANTTTGTLELWDDSEAYGRFDAHGLRERIAAAGHRLSRLTVTIA